VSSERELEVLLRAAYPIICVSSPEEDRVESALRRILDDRNKKRGTRTPLLLWSITEGCYNSMTGELNDEVRLPLEMLNYIGDYSSPAIFSLRDFHHYYKDDAPAGFTLQRKLKDLVTKLTSAGKHIILTGNVGDIPGDLEHLVAFVDFDLPTEEEISRVLTESLFMPELAKEKSRLDDNPEEFSKLVESIKGLSLFEAESVIAKSIASVRKIDIPIILSEKKHIIRKSGVLEFYETDSGMADVGGLDVLKEWLDNRGNAFSSSARDFGLPYPKGVLIIGIPGTGKSLISKAIGSAWSMPVLRLDVGSLFGSFIGQSEANMRKALKTAEALAPCVLWIDELEKSLGGSSGGTDSGTTARVFGSFLNWMQEKSDPVFVVATANDVSQLPPEMLRKGRFDELFFVDLPSREDRNEIFKIHLSLRGRDPSDYEVEELGLASDQFSGAEIESVVVDGLYRAFSVNRELHKNDMLRSIMDTVPLAKTMGSKIESLRKWAKTRARFATSSEGANNLEKLDFVDATSVTRGRKVDFS